MGNNSSSPNKGDPSTLPKDDQKQIQLHKNKPQPNDLPPWFTSLKLVSDPPVPKEKEKKF